MAKKRINIYVDEDIYKEFKKVCALSGETVTSVVDEAMKEYIGTDCIIVCHGGVIAGLMLTWFPGDETAEHFYAWQPKPSEGYKIIFNDDKKPVSYEKITLG